MTKIRVQAIWDLDVEGSDVDIAAETLTIGVPEFEFTFGRPEPRDVRVTSAELVSLDVEPLG